MDFEFLGNKNPKIEAPNGEIIKLEYSKKDLRDYEIFSQYIGGVKRLVRTDARYTNYKSYLYSIGLNRCAIFSNLPIDSCDLEMHHGPCFTLADLIAIATDHILEDSKTMNAFDMADLILTEHEKYHNVQLVMLCETAHEGVEAGEMFIPFKAGFGHIDKFIGKYYKGLRKEHFENLFKYVELSKKYNSTDNGVMELYERYKKYIRK